MTVEDDATAAAARLAAIRAGADALLDEGAFRAKAEVRLAALPDTSPPDHGAEARAERADRRRETWAGHLGTVSEQNDITLTDDQLPATDLDVTQIAARLGESRATADKILARGDLPSTVTTDGSRVATASAVDAWIAQRDRQRATIRELAGEAQLTEGDAPPSQIPTRVHRRAMQALGSEKRAARWMAERHPALGGATPRDHARTRAGADEVRALLIRIEHGVVG